MGITFFSGIFFSSYREASYIYDQNSQFFCRVEKKMRKKATKILWKSSLIPFSKMNTKIPFFKRNIFLKFTVSRSGKGEKRKLIWSTGKKFTRCSKFYNFEVFSPFLSAKKKKEKKKKKETKMFL